MEDTRQTLSIALILSYKRSTNEKKEKKGAITQGKITEKNERKIENKRDLKAAIEESQ